MPKPGDRVIIDGLKLGAPRRQGKLLEQVGSLIKVRWDDGSESLLTPGAGTTRFEPGRAPKTDKATQKTPAKGAAKASANGKERPAAAKPASAKAPKKGTKTAAKKATKKK